MVKKISALLIAFLGSVLLLFGCGDPYKNFSLSVSKSDVILYLSDEEGLVNSEDLTATINGAAKGISTDVTFSQYGANGVNDIVTIENVSKNGNTTNFTLKANKVGRGVIHVNSNEGTKRAEINVTVYIPIKSVDFVTKNKAVKFGGEVDLSQYLTFLPQGTNQTETKFYIEDFSGNEIQKDETGGIYETTYAKIEGNKLISKHALTYPKDENGIKYVNVYAVSDYNNQIRTQVVKIYVIDVVDVSQIVLSTNSDASTSDITLVPTSQKDNLYDIILGQNSTEPFIFSRELKIKIGDSYLTDKQYTITTSLDNASSNVINVQEMVKDVDRQSYGGVEETYPYKRYFINQQINSNKTEEIFNLYIDRAGFEGLFTITLKIRVTVKTFGEAIAVTDESGNSVVDGYVPIYNVYGGSILGTPLTVFIDPNSTDFKMYATVENAPDTNGKRGFEIYLRNNMAVTSESPLTTGTTIFIKHNYSFNDLQTVITNPFQDGCPKLVIKYSYNLAPTTVTTGYKTYTVTTEIPLVAQAGITDLGFQTTSPIKINAITGKAVGIEEPEGPEAPDPEGGEGEPEAVYEIVVGTINEQKVDLQSMIKSVTVIAVNGETNVDFNVFDNEYFMLEYRISETTRFRNRIVVVPYLQPKQVTVDFVIQTTNYITKRIRIEVFVPVVYSAEEIPQHKVHAELLEDDESRNAVYEASNVTEYYIGIQEGGEVSIMLSNEVETPEAYVLSKTYTTQNAFTMAVNSTVGINIYNYVVMTENEQQVIKEVNYNDNVTVVVNRNYFNVEYRNYNGIRTPFITAGNIKTEVPIDLNFIVAGYNSDGMWVTLTKTIKLNIIKPVTSIQLTPLESTIYEKNSLGYFKIVESEIDLNLKLFPTNAVSPTDSVKPDISFEILDKDRVVASYQGKRENGSIYTVEFLVSDFVKIVPDVDNNKCLVIAEQSAAYKQKLADVINYDISFTEQILINQIYKQQDLIVTISASLTQYSKPTITSNVSVKIQYAQKVTNIIASVDEKGIYFDSRDFEINGDEIIGDGAELSFELEPSIAHNKTLTAYIQDTSIAKIVSGVDSNNRIISNTIVVKPYINAGRTALRIAAEDSYVQNLQTGYVEPTVYVDISVRVANGTKQYPFEISNAKELLEVGRDINLGNDSYYYVLSDSITLTALETIGETLPPFKKFNGGLSGLFTYNLNGIDFVQQNYIYDFSLTKQIESVNGVQYKIGLFEELSATAEIESLIFEGANLDIALTNQTHTDRVSIGVIAGVNNGSILNSRVNGTINVNSQTQNVNVGGMVGESNTLIVYEYVQSGTEYLFTNKTSGIISYLPNSSTQSSSSKLNSEVVINYVGASANDASTEQVNIGGVAGAAYTYAKHAINTNAVTALIALGYDFLNENVAGLQTDVSVYQRESGSAYTNLNVSATISAVNESNALLKANVGGAFGYANSTYIKDVTIAPNLMAKTNVGGLVGYAEHCLIDSAVVEFANAGQTGVNTISLVSETNVGGLVGYGDNLNIYYSYVRSYFNNSGINNTTYYGNIALLQNASVANKYAGGLVGYLEISQVSDVTTNFGIKNGSLDLSLPTQYAAGGLDESLYNVKYAATINNSYFSADINLQVQELSGNVYASGLVGAIKEIAGTVTDIQKLKITNSYSTGNINANTEDVYAYETKQASAADVQIGTSVEFKVGIITVSGNDVTFTEQTSGKLVKIETVIDGTTVDGSFLKVVKNYTVYNNYGAFVGNEVNKLTLTTQNGTSTVDTTENVRTTTTQNIDTYTYQKQFVSNVVVETSYIANFAYSALVYTGENTTMDIATFAVTKTIVVTEALASGVVTSTDQTIASEVNKAQLDLTKTESYIVDADNRFNIVQVVDQAAPEGYADYIWLHYLGPIYKLNNGYPVLFKYSHANGEILFKVLPTNININLLDIEAAIEFSNTSYIKQNETSVVVFYNEYVSGKNNKVANKYKILLNNEDVASSTTYTNLAKITLDLPNLAEVGIVADYADELVITSSNINVVRVLSDMVIETLSEGVAVIRIASKLDVSIYDEVTLLVERGISDYNIYKNKNITVENNLIEPNMQYDQFIDNTSNYYIAPINRDKVTNYNGYYVVNSNVGVKLVVNEDNDGKAKLNGAVLEVGKTYLFSSLSEFNFTGIGEGLVKLTLTPFIKSSNAAFGETLTASDGTTIDNCIVIDKLQKNYLFNVKPKAERLEIDKTTATLDPSKYVDLKVSVVTSNFRISGEVITVNEDILTLITDKYTNASAGSISLLNPAENSVNTSLINLEVLECTATKIEEEGKSLKVQADYKLRLSFDGDRYKDRSGGETFNINNIEYSFNFSPKTNYQLNKTFNIKIVPKPVSDIKLKFYANSEVVGSGENASFNPQEVESDFIVPSRMGLLKLELFPEFNDAEVVEVTVPEKYKNYVSFDQKLAVMQGGESGYAVNYQSLTNRIEYLPNFVGVKLKNQSIIAEGKTIYNGNYYLQVSLDEDAPINENIKFTATAYKYVGGAKVELKSSFITLNVQPLPSVNLLVNGQKEGLINVGGRVDLTVEASNFEGDIELSVISSQGPEVIGYEYDEIRDKYSVFVSPDAQAGEVIRVQARVSRFINGIQEVKESEVKLQVVEYIITGIKQKDAMPNGNVYAVEILNGTPLLLNMAVSAIYDTSNSDITARINTFALEASGRIMSGGGSEYVNNWYLKLSDNSYEKLNYNATYENFAFQNKTSNGITQSHYFAINGKKVSSNNVIGLKVQYYYNSIGQPTLYNGSVVGYVVYEQEFDFNVIIKDNSTYDHPNPIATAAEFLALKEETGGHYILVNDITLSDYEPINASFASLDGNGYRIKITNFNTSSLAGGSNVNVGLFGTVSASTVIKNVTLDVSSLLITQDEVNMLVNEGTTNQFGDVVRNAKIDLSGISSFNFGLFAGTNDGSLTNIKIVNPVQTNMLDNSAKHLFIYSTFAYLNGELVDAKIGGMVAINNGTISNSYIGLNAANYQNVDYSTEFHATTNGEFTSGEQTYPFFLVGGKSIGAFVNENTGIVANSYNLGVGVINRALIFEGTKTSGFVVTNKANGYIFNSMSEGIETLNYRVGNKVYIEAKGYIGGFVYENEGKIENAFSNISITTNSGGSGGFVYNNKQGGLIKNAYSTSPNAFNSKSHGQFTGINSKNDYNNEGTLTSCFYLILDSEVANEDEPALAIRGKSVTAESANADAQDNPFRYTGSFNGFSFTTGTSINNIWKIDSNQHYGPQLISITEVNTFSHRVLTNTTNEGGTTIYDYEYNIDCMYGAANENSNIVNPLLVNTAEEFVTFIINNSRAVSGLDGGGNELFKLNLFGNKANNGVSQIRLINDLDFTEITLNNLVVDRKLISQITFAGVLDGNGMTMKGIKLVDLDQDTIHENYGLFQQVGLSDYQIEKTGIEATNITPSIQNLNIEINGFDATHSVKVGAIAGSIYNTSLINLTLSAGDGVNISGGNLVGGLAGLIVNKSEAIINNITTNNITATASHRSNATLSEVNTINSYGVAHSNGNMVKFASFDDYTGNTYSVSDLRNYSYAGSIAGVLVANNRDSANAYSNVATAVTADIMQHRPEDASDNVAGITVQGGGFIAAEQAGGLFGYTGKNTFIRKSKYLVGFDISDDEEDNAEKVQNIRGYNYAGGIVGENHAMLEQVTLEHISSLQASIDESHVKGANSGLKVKNLFGTEVAVAIGGLVGYTDQSIIADSFVKVDVINPNAKIAGGVIGLATRTNYLTHVYTTSDVYASKVVGGVIGVYNKTGLFVVDDSTANLNVKDADGNTVLTSANARLTLDYVIAANSFGSNTQTMASENLKLYYAKSDGTFYQYVVRMPEVGNQEYIVDGVTYNSNWLGRSTFGNSTYVGSLIGLVKQNGVISQEEKERALQISEANIVTAVNVGRQTSTVNTGYGTNFTLSNVISTTVNNAKISTNTFNETSVNTEHHVSEVFNDAVSSPSKPTATNPNIVGDMISFENIIGNQYHLNTIFGKSGTNANMFGSYAWDIADMASINASSGSKIWMVKNDLPAFIIGIYSNFNTIANRSELNTQIRVSSDTKNQFYLLKHNEYDFATENETTYQPNPVLMHNKFEGTIIGEPNAGENPLITVKQLNALSSVFSDINNATIMNVDFKIIIPDNYFSYLSEKEATSKSFGLISKHISGSVLSNINVEIEFEGGDIRFLDSFENLGLLFGHIEDSELNNINIEITYTGDKAPQITFEHQNVGSTPTVKSNNMNFGILVGKSERSVISNVNINSVKAADANETQIIDFNDTEKTGTINIGTIAGYVASGAVEFVNNTRITKDYTNGQIKVNSTSTASSVAHNIGGVIGYVKGSNVSQVYYIGNVLAGDSTTNLTTKLNVGAIVGRADSSTLSVLMSNTYNYIENQQIKVYANYENKVDVYNDSTSGLTCVGGIVGNATDVRIIGSVNDKVSVASDSIINVNAKANINVGGVAGKIYNSAASYTINKAYSSGTITVKNNNTATTSTYVGGLVGNLESGRVDNVYAVGDITVETTSNYYVAGLIGYASCTNGDSLRISTFAAYGDIYIKGLTPDINRYVAGVVGVIASDKITLNNGYTVTRVYNANNGNSAYATSNYINGLGYPSTVSETMFNNVYFVREFFPYTNTQKMKNNSNVEIGKVSVKSNDGSQFGGITYGQLTNILTQRLTPNAGNSNTDYGFNTISQNYLEYQSGSTNSINLRLPLISGVADVDVVCESNGNEMIKTRGNKLNPIILTANYSQNIDDKYYILKSEDLIDTYTLKISNATFKGLIAGTSTSVVSNVKFVNSSNTSQIKNDFTNNGILANFKVAVSTSYNLAGALVRTNNGNIVNVVTYGYLTPSSAPTAADNKVATFVGTNNANIVASGSIVMIAYGSGLTYSSYSGFVTVNSANNAARTGCGTAFIKDCYSTSSYINTHATATQGLNAQSAGLIYTNNGILETSYYAGTFDSAKASTNSNGNVVVYLNNGIITNCYFDVDATTNTNGAGTRYATAQTIANVSGVRYALTDEFIKGDFVQYALQTTAVSSSFANYNYSINYGYPTIRDGININTLQSNKFILYHKGQIDNLSAYAAAGYFMVTNINMSGVNTGVDVNKIAPQDSLGAEFDGKGYTISNLRIENSSTSFGLFKTIAGKTVKDLTFNNAVIVGNATSAASGTVGVGILGGYVSGSTISDVKVLGTSSVTANNYINVGGLVGYANNTSISFTNNTSINVDVDVTVEYGNYVGGVVGKFASTGGNKLTKAKFSGTVKAKNKVGGIIGSLDSGSIESCVTVTGSTVNSTDDFSSLSSTESFKSGHSTAVGKISTGDNNNAGGVVGEMLNASSMLNCYPETNVTVYGNYKVGGVVGVTKGTSTVQYNQNYELSSLTIAPGETAGVVAAGGVIGYMDGNSLTNTGGVLTVKSSTIASNSSKQNFAIGGIVGFQNKGTINSVKSDSNTLTGARLIGGVVGYQKGTLNNATSNSNTLNSHTDLEMDEDNGFGYSPKAGAASNYYNMPTAITSTNYRDYLGCITINSTTTVDGYLLGTYTENRLDEKREYFAVEYGGVDLRSKSVPHGTDSSGYIKLYFGFVSGALDGNQTSISVTGSNKIVGLYDYATTYVVHRNRDDFDWDNDWWWYLRKRIIQRTFTITDNTSDSYYNVFDNGTNNYTKFHAITETFDKPYAWSGTKAYSIIGTDWGSSYYWNYTNDYNILSYIAAGYSNAYKNNVDPISYIQDTMSSTYSSYCRDTTVKSCGVGVLQNMYSRHAYKGMTKTDYKTISNWKSEEFYYGSGWWGGDLYPTDLNKSNFGVSFTQE